MPNMQETVVRPMRIRTRTINPPTPEPTPPTLPVNSENAPRISRFWRNLAVAGALVLCAVTLRTGAVPSLDAATDLVLTAATDDSLLDDDLGKLSFVSALFPEAVLVFGQQDDASLSMPVSGGVVVHAWSEAEPYMSWRTGSSQVTSASSGEVAGVYHGMGEELLVEVRGNDGLSCIYGNLAETFVRTGDAVAAGEALGTLAVGADAVFEVRREGMSIDPALYLGR